MSIYLYFISIIILLLANVPIAFALIIPSIAYYYFTPGFTLFSAMGVLLNTANSFPLLAVPVFILLGHIMNQGGVTRRLFDFARALTGHFSGGLAYANVLASLLFSGMSGSALADVGGLGIVELQAMQEEGYDRGFSCAITGASAVIGPIFPPSVPLVIFGVYAEVSIGKLLAGGMLPGLLITAVLMLAVYIISKKENFPTHERASLNRIVISFVNSFPAIFTVILILLGIFSGIVTPTESAVLGLIYVLFLSIFIYKELTFKLLIEGIKESIYTISSVMLVVAGSFLFSRIITLSGFSNQVIKFVISNVRSPFLFLLLLNIFLLLLGMIMEGIAALAMVIPIVLPIAKALSIDPVHLGVIMVYNLMLGLVTPPFGEALFVLVKIGGIPFGKIAASILQFYPYLLIALFIITYYPPIVLYIPNILFGG